MKTFASLPALHLPAFNRSAATRRHIGAGLCLIFAALAVSGCADMRGISPQSKITDSNTLAAGSAIHSAGIDANWPKAAWWHAYADPQLDGLVQQAISGSPTLKIARARVELASSLAGIARANTLPQVGAKAETTRELFTGQGLFPPPLAGNWDWDNEIAVKASYDLDLWEKDKNALEAALDTVHASAAEARSAQLQLETSVVRSYLHLALQYQLRDVAAASLQQQESIASIARRRLRAGLGTQLELSQAETSLPVAHSNIEQLDESISLLRNQIAALSGQGPGAGDAIQRPRLLPEVMGKASTQLPIVLPDYVPANLIGRRPDVVAQRWRVEAAGKNIAVAKAGFYPDINISAFLGFQSIGFAGFLTANSAIRGIAPAISLPIFEGGRLRSRLGAETANYDAAVESYNNTLVLALQSVADQIVKLKSSEKQKTQIEQALALAQTSYELAQRGFHSGISEYLTVLNAQTVLLQQQQRMEQVNAVYLDTWAQLMQALGGGLEEKTAPAIASTRP
ncbi:efflux transporter outer membrane subunit [Undibacterium sp.]|jgi:NodT family efflux transporter outer membrane factor (OMF) lipoprotein|uniref:efflux transporter outer membrane subunit n=1 Tax=Undibacterium sp. TaxID=1914977 RepID=UPI002C0642B9|nr:efflux transporter outer membrane subunit [Undibacterium sp.]HTD03283.1 efflux transporter outer membrane subunit [Undibacterium sp.]